MNTTKIIVVINSSQALTELGNAEFIIINMLTVGTITLVAWDVFPLFQPSKGKGKAAVWETVGGGSIYCESNEAIRVEVG